MKPWTETWKEELACALEVGAAGEEKVSYQLWPEHNRPLNGINSCDSEPIIASDLFCAARCFRGDAAANGSIYSLNMEKQLPNRPFARYQVIYKDRKTAFLLKPNLAPSSYHGRCPVAKILRGLTVGLPVVRGFDRRSWNRLQGPKKAAVTAEDVPAVNAQEEISSECPACSAEKDRGQITDLVLVAHGIGQKIAERVESYHFTHAINSFRRAVNIELGNPTIQNVLRADQNGFMILPLNWRVGLSFDSDDATPTGTKDTTGSFDLKDIEPSTIPAVRSMISDVMFDIPFYMSHHKIKMITALVREANRVYRLWCRNNPGFSDKGRVHLIAHSLGSVMAVDILSRQPTSVPRLNLCTPIAPDDQHFEFNTTNLFLAGSPAGFFLLLEKGALMPRCGRTKAGADDGDVVAKNVVGEAGTFGCLAVDNVYNVLAKEDPIAYLLTGAIDPSYSSSLKVAYVPSVTPSLISTVRDAIRQVVPGLNPEPDPLAIEPQRPTTARMPSQLELEIHDFTREEIAEKKAYLLNDNGQIDWFLRSSGGPLEIQYLNMLSAHTSYWTNQDFIRMVCLEIGRKPGRSHTFPAMRAVKKRSETARNSLHTLRERLYLRPQS
ncbi:putative phospholipase [Beauveria bassiana]|uniref:Putative phospholipase n=1 Tax=Beauveria bassiana TaxID=176275 RepID=A0A2N6P1T2_BEABA|nr:putative phospholipase [Beauveria bassiana]